MRETPTTAQISADDILEIAMERGEVKQAPIVPYEATAALCMLLLRDYSMLTVHFVGVPPGGADLLIKFLPPETLARFGGPKKFAQALDASLTKLGRMLRRRNGCGSSCSAATPRACCPSRVLSQREAVMKQVWQKVFARAPTTPAPLAALLVLLLSLAAAQAQERSRLDEVLQRGSLIVVTLGTVPPFAFKDDKGELVGFDIDVARLAANALFRDPNKLEFVVVTSDGRRPAIESGRADMGTGGTTVYPDRAIRVAFTRAVIDFGISIMVAKSSGIKSLEDLNQEKHTVANLNNPQMADRAQLFFPKSKIITFDTPSGEFLAVKRGAPRRCKSTRRPPTISPPPAPRISRSCRRCSPPHRTTPSI